MSRDAISKNFANIALFDGLSLEQLTEISGIAERAFFQQGATLAACGEPSDKAILVVDGELECTGGVSLATPLAGNQAGRMIAEMAMFIEDFKHSSTFVARTPTKALVIQRAAMLAKLEADRQLAALFIKNIASRLNGTLTELKAVENSLRPEQPANIAEGRAA
ncbi:MAG: cyclic nucleotide-binding domain-containing protein [Hyphomicrobiaceae bacterium]